MTHESAEIDPQEAPVPATGIVVGVDGSDQGDCAVIWAAREAERQHLPLHLVTAYSVPVFAASGLDGGYATVDDDVIRESARAVVAHAQEKVASFNIDVDARVESGDAAGVLLDLSKTATMLVFGTRGRGGFVGRLLGSVSSALPAHSHCPTVTVPLTCAARLGEAPAHPGKDQSLPQDVKAQVTVGVDGSEQARSAVLTAAEYAMSSGLSLRVLCAVPPYNGSLAWMPAAVDHDGLFEEIRGQLAAGKSWLQSHFPKLDISMELIDAQPVEALIEASRESELLVLGSRGKGGFAGMLLGSTTDGVLHHAKGPVMVVRDVPDPRLEDRPSFGPLLGTP
ncbi:MAG: universal stress protein [Acidobacteria bacterium]|nr:universal stress protein [Acidobacteriota bacterium]